MIKAELCFLTKGALEKSIGDLSVHPFRRGFSSKNGQNGPVFSHEKLICVRYLLKGGCQLLLSLRNRELRAHA